MSKTPRGTQPPPLDYAAPPSPGLRRAPVHRLLLGFRHPRQQSPLGAASDGFLLGVLAGALAGAAVAAAWVVWSDGGVALSVLFPFGGLVPPRAARELCTGIYLGQFPAYGVALGLTANRGRLGRAAAWLAVAHTTAAAVALVTGAG